MTLAMTESQSLQHGGHIRCVVSNAVEESPGRARSGWDTRLKTRLGHLVSDEGDKMEYLGCRCWVVSLFGGGQAVKTPTQKRMLR
jgi:hypothetical protein